MEKNWGDTPSATLKFHFKNKFHFIQTFINLCPIFHKSCFLKSIRIVLRYNLNPVSNIPSA